MCRLRENELYRLKFRKKFVKNGQEEMSSVREVSTREDGVRGGKGEEGGVWSTRSGRTRIRKSTFTNDPLHLSSP